MSLPHPLGGMLTTRGPSPARDPHGMVLEPVPTAPVPALRPGAAE